jgi:uncharacterized circularly permuted ATP-grasp superfamily protein
VRVGRRELQGTALISDEPKTHPTIVQVDAPSFQTNVALPAVSEFQPVLRPTELDLGGSFKTQTTNFQVDEAGRPRDDSPPARVVLKRPPEVQDRINQRVTARHADGGMDFCKKNKVTGRYDTYFDVPVSAFLLTMEKHAYDRLIRSTEPVMRAFRDIAQVVYSKIDPTPEDFGVSDIPPGDREIFMRCIRECIYFEPKLVDPAFRSYPFIPIVGFDAAPDDPRNPEPVFHEANAGTPSGLSNNNQLLEHLRREDPEQVATIEDRLFSRDDTFPLLRQAIDSCALEWTQNPNGISVVIGPGPANGAHPDVASIAAYSGMPMVYPHDLYRDRDGNIRMLTGDPKHDPIVTGIYGRTEETFFFQDDELQIPIRSPDFARNDEIAGAVSKKHGRDVELKKNVAYQYLYRNPEEIKDWSDPKEIKDVAFDRAGRPKLMSTWSQLSPDPTRPEVPPGKLAEAVKQKKLYFSGFGGRIVDHKALFAIVSKYLAPKLTEGGPIARPPRTLSPEEDGEYYANPRAFVTKPPDASGGEGVHIGPVLSEEALAASVERTRKQRDRIVVQDFWTTALTTDVKTDKQTGAKYYGTTIPDIRVFSLLFADGSAHAGEQSFLIRTDVQDIGKTNTGSGGGYGILAILGEPGRRKELGAPLTPPRPEVPHVAKKHMEELLAFLVELNAITEAADLGTLAKNGRARALGEQYLRPVMDLLGEEAMPLLRLTRRFDAGELSQAELNRALLELRYSLLTKEYPNGEVSRQVRQQLALYRPRLANEPMKKVAAMVRPEVHYEITGLPVPLPARFQLSEDVLLLATGRVVTTDPALSQWIERMRSEGGEVEIMRAQQRTTGQWVGGGFPPSFYLDDRSCPRIALAADSNDLYADLMSVAPKLERWLETRNELIEDGNLPAKAAELAFEFHRQSERRITRESLASMIANGKRERAVEQDYLQRKERALSKKQSPTKEDQAELLRVRVALAANRDRLVFDDLFPSLEQRGLEKDGSFDRLVEMFRSLGEEVPRFQPRSRWRDTLALLWQQQQQQQQQETTDSR